MACNMPCQICKRLVYSQAITFADGTLTINIPAGSYANGTELCLVLTQAIPADATIAAPVVITIGAGTAEYPLVNRCCTQVTACGVRTRTRYPVRIVTSPTGASVRMLGRACCAPNYDLTAIDGTTTAAAAEGA